VPAILRRLNQRFSLAAQDVGLQPVMEMQPDLLFGMLRYPVAGLIEPGLGFAQPATCLLELAEALVGQRQSQPVGHGSAHREVRLTALLEDRRGSLELAGPVRHGSGAAVSG
jgi:hypothetical protein